MKPLELVLHKAAAEGDVDTLLNVVKNDKVDVNCENQQKRTALHIACWGKKLDCVQVTSE